MTTNTKTRNQRATYWSYRGNHPAGHDCSRYNKHGYPMSLVAYLSYHRGEGVKVSGFGGDQFGSTIQVDAPKETWLEAWVDLAEELGWEIKSQFDEIREDSDGTIWAVIKGFEEDEDRFIEVFYKSVDETRLEMIQRGYVPIGVHNGEEIWVADGTIGKGA